MADKFLLIFKSLKEISVKSFLRHILIDLHFFILVSLPDDTAITLGHIGRPPAHIQMMDGDQPVLHIGSGPHFLCAAHENSDLAASRFGE